MTRGKWVALGVGLAVAAALVPYGPALWRAVACERFEENLYGGHRRVVGQRFRFGQYRGQEHGIVEEFYGRSGGLRSRVRYDRGERVGVQTFWDKEGNVAAQLEYPAEEWRKTPPWQPDCSGSVPTRLAQESK